MLVETVVLPALPVSATRADCYKASLKGRSTEVGSEVRSEDCSAHSADNNHSSDIPGLDTGKDSDTLRQ